MASSTSIVFRLLVELKRHDTSIVTILRYALISRYGLPELFIQWPRTVVGVAKALFVRLRAPVYAFTPSDLRARTTYAKFACNLRRFGRFGYAWDEGLGIPMGPRFYQNSATYAIYGSLSAQQFSVLTTVTFLTSLVMTGYANGATVLSLVLAFVLMGSPALIFSLVAHGTKPEVLWWALAVPALVGAFEGWWAVVWLALGVLLLVNASVAVILGLFLIGPVAWTFVETGSAGGAWMAASIPGFVKLAVRVAHAYREGWLGTLRSAQTRFVRTVRPSVSPEQIALGVGAPLVLASWGRWDAAAILSATAIAFYVINLRAIKLADTVTVQLVTLCAGVAAALLAQHWFSVVGVVMLGYSSPLMVAPADPEGDESPDAPAAAPVGARINQIRGTLHGYPWLTPMEFPRPASLMRLFERVPNGGRLLMESAGDARTASHYATFRSWTNEFLPERQIEFINQTFWVGVMEPDLAERYVDRFNARHLTPEVMHEVCRALGIRFVIAYTAETTNALRCLGYDVVTSVDREEYREFAEVVRMPSRTLVLLASPEPRDVVSPGVAWARSDNAIAWNARAGQTYVLRYRFSPSFAAWQDDTPLTVERAQVLPDVPLAFMSIRAVRDGRLTVRFRKRWVGA